MTDSVIDIIDNVVWFVGNRKMVAQKKGRGAKAQAAAKAKAAAVEEQVPETEQEQVEAAEENNGDAEQVEEGAAAEGGDASAEAAAEGADGEAKAEEKKEEKVESGKLLVENLPSSYLFDYQDKLKELFSKHGEVTGVKWVWYSSLYSRFCIQIIFANIQISVPKIVMNFIHSMNTEFCLK